MSIYKPCDVRGRVETELTPELYRNWGRVLGGQVVAQRPFVVGGDVRGSTPGFLEALIDGLCETPVEVIRLGVLPTPMIYFAKRHLGAAGCAIVTASHNPAEINGLKWMIGDRPPTQRDVETLKRQAEQRSETLRAGPARQERSNPRDLDIEAEYLSWLKAAWGGDSSAVRLRVVLDPMHGCWAGRARAYLEEVFPGAQFSAIHDTPEQNLAGLTPDCSRPERLKELGEAVLREKADLGVAFDGDGDRIALVDGDGSVLTPEQATWVMLHSFGDQLAGGRFVYDLKFSDRVREAAGQLGAEPIAERSGHAFIRARMLKTRAKFGAEISGHYFFDALEGGDDGLYASGRLMAWLGLSATTLAEQGRGAPAVFITPDLRLPVRLEDRERLIEEVRSTWSQYPQTTVDGVRIDFPDGWALMRGSVTEAALTFRFEAADRQGLDRLVGRFCDASAELGAALQARYEKARRDWR